MEDQERARGKSRKELGKGKSVNDGIISKRILRRGMSKEEWVWERSEKGEWLLKSQQCSMAGGL
jgi:hypothetical protein